MNQIGNSDLSMLRPAWTQYDLYAYQHLHTIKGVAKDHFVQTRGFRTKQDLEYAKRGQRR